MLRLMMFGYRTEVTGVFLSALLLATAAHLTPPTYDLHVMEGMSDKKLAVLPVAISDRITVEYRHSIYGIKQKEVFSIRGACFDLKEVEFGSVAAALYYDSNLEHNLSPDKHRWSIQSNGKVYPVLKYRVSPSTEHVLRVGNQTIDLSTISDESGKLICLFLARRPHLRM